MTATAYPSPEKEEDFSLIINLIKEVSEKGNISLKSANELVYKDIMSGTFRSVCIILEDSYKTLNMSNYSDASYTYFKSKQEEDPTSPQKLNPRLKHLLLSPSGTNSMYPSVADKMGLSNFSESTEYLDEINPNNEDLMNFFLREVNKEYNRNA